MPEQFKLLLANPVLESTEYQTISSAYLTQCLATELRLAKPRQNKPFILSCFALSVDGRLCFPDLPSGFAIAKCNYVASLDERNADWWSLCLGRSISDAVIIGSNSLNLEQHNYHASIDIPQLQQLRQELNKPKQLLHIVLSRSLAKINFTEELICQNNQIPLLIFTQSKPQQIPANFTSCSLNEFKQLTTKQIIYNEAGLDIELLIQRLMQCGIKTILNESPYYHHELQQLKLLDEAWINSSGIYIGGNVSLLGQANHAFSSLKHPHYTLLSLHALGYNFLYGRYRINYQYA